MCKGCEGIEPTEKADHCQPGKDKKTIDEKGKRLRLHGSKRLGQSTCVKGKVRDAPERADLRVWMVNGKSWIKTVQYVRFPGGPPPEYWTRPWLLSFGDRTGSGVSNQV
jgi:hypothetical protein